MSNAAAMGTKMVKSGSLRKLKEKMKGITRTVYNPQQDPQFYLFLNRLADAEEFKKTDRVDGRRALNDFIVEHDSIMYVQGVRKAEKAKREF